MFADLWNFLCKMDDGTKQKRGEFADTEAIAKEKILNRNKAEPPDKPRITDMMPLDL